jgi:hypothetical protein
MFIDKLHVYEIGSIFSLNLKLKSVKSMISSTISDFIPVKIN